MANPSPEETLKLASENGITITLRITPGMVKLGLKDSLKFQEVLHEEYNRARIQLMDELRKWRELSNG